MAVRYICDSCGENTDTMQEFGYARKAQYCPDCVLTIENYYTVLDTLHEKVAKMWQAGLTNLRKDMRKGMKSKEAKLPDE